MLCDEVRFALLDGPPTMLTAEQQAHFSQCANCQAFAADLDFLQEQVNSLPPAEPPAGLAARIKAALSSTPRLAAGEEPRIIHQREKKMPQILVVDDEPNIVRLMQVNLERQGYRVDTASNGMQALAKVRDRRPDLLVSDVMMPEMDGFELLSSIRRDPALSDLPVIMLTAKTQDNNVMEGYSRGADMYLTKPFNPQELLQFVKRILSTSSGGDDGAYRI